MNRFNKKGFTLIELLVVVAIIGILASIILVALNAARKKTKDARVKGAMSQVRNQAQIFFDEYGHYGTGSDSTGPKYLDSAGYIGADGIIKLKNEVQNNSGSPLVINYTWRSPSPVHLGYVAVGTLSDGSHWCVDYLGYAGPGVSLGNTEINSYDSICRPEP